jgi:hypothetical protein
MDLNLQAALAALPANAAFRVANERVPDGDYLFNTILPERNVPSYHVDAGSMTIRATMAGLVGMDSPYPPGGLVDISTFLENTAKIANQVNLSEAVLRQMQELVMRLTAQGMPTVETVQRNLLNFLDKVVIQPHIDRFEWMRGRALLGQSAVGYSTTRRWISTTAFRPRTFLANRTRQRRVRRRDVEVLDGCPNDSPTTQKQRPRDHRARHDGRRHPRQHRDQRLSHGRRDDDRRAVASSTVTLRRLNPTNGQFSADVGDTVTLVAYDGEGEVIDPADPKSTIVVPFMDAGKLLGIGNNVGRGFSVGQGSTDNPDADQAIGYTHIAPTIEGGGRPGRWSDVFTPENAPWMVVGRAVTNGIPVIQDPTKVAIASSDMP